MVEAGAVLEAEEAFGRPLAGQERLVALVDVGGDQLRALRVRAGDEDGRNAANVGCEPGSVEVADRGLGRDQHLAAEVAALLLGRELVFEVNAADARFDIGLHDLEAVEGAPKARLRVGDDRREPVALGSALAVLDLVGALQRAVDLAWPARDPCSQDRATGRDTWSRRCWRRPQPASRTDRSPSGPRGPSALPDCPLRRRARGPARLAAEAPTAETRRAGRACARSAASRGGAARLRRYTDARSRRSGREERKPRHQSQSLRIPCDLDEGKHGIVVNDAQIRAKVTELDLCTL